MSSNLPPKKDVCRALLTRGSVFIHLDPRKSRVLVPARLRLQAQVVLQIGTDMPVPIPDLRVDDEGVYGTLSFKGVPFTCFLPWASIFAIVGEDSGGLVWNSEVPSEIRAEVDKDSKKASARKKPKALPPGVVSLEAARLTTPKSERTTPRKSDRPASERPAHLRLVK